MIPELRAFTFGEHEVDDDKVPMYHELGWKLLFKDEKEEIHFSIDLITFSCKGNDDSPK